MDLTFAAVVIVAMVLIARPPASLLREIRQLIKSLADMLKR